MAPPREQSNNTRITAFFKPKPTPAVPAVAENSSTTSKCTRNVPAETANSPPAVTAAAPSMNLNSSASEMQIDSPTASQSSTPPTPPTAHKAADTRVIPDSDGEESDDDSDFDDIGGLGSFLGKTAKPPAPPPQAPPPQPAKREFLGMPGSSTTKKRAPMNSLDKLLADVERRKALDAQLEQVRESLEKRHNGVKPKRSAISAQEAQSVIGPEISGHRFVSALERKQAFEVDEVWKFFDQDDNDPIPEPAFPSSSIRDDETFNMMTDEFVREDLFVSGFVNDMALCGIFPPSAIITWMLDQVCFERTRQDLSWAYTQALVTILTSPSFHAQNNGLLTRSRIRALWRILGAREDALHTESPMNVSTHSDKNTTITGTWNVGLLIELLACTVDPNDQELSATVCELLIRLSLDVSVLRHSDIVLKVTGALDRILSGIADERWEAQARVLGSLLMEHVPQPQNQCRILEILPLRTPQLHLFRRRLALCFLFKDASYMTRAQEDLVDLGRFTTLLENDDTYKITSKTDHQALRARMSILDVAVDAGATAEKYAKDSEVDRLVDALRRVFASISDNNAQNIKRTEAKESIERLQFRLRFGVRKKPLQALDGNLDRDGKIQSKLSFSPIQA